MHFQSTEKLLEQMMVDKQKKHLPNKKYFFLHRERDEKIFKKGDKIISATRTLQPAFTYTTDEFYGSRALNFIKSNRINLGYLSAIFNSKLSYFWLKYMGKMMTYHGMKFYTKKMLII